MCSISAIHFDVSLVYNFLIVVEMQAAFYWLNETHTHEVLGCCNGIMVAILVVSQGCAWVFLYPKSSDEYQICL